MRKRFFLLFIIAALAWAGSATLQSQRKGRGRGWQGPSVTRQRSEHSRTQERQREQRTPSQTRRRQDRDQKKALSDAQLDSGSFRRLQETTGMSREELQALYQQSGTRNFGQFVSAVMVADKLGLDRNQVLEGLHEKKLSRVLQDVGVDRERASDAMTEVQKEMKREKRRPRS